MLLCGLFEPVTTFITTASAIITAQKTSPKGLVSFQESCTYVPINRREFPFAMVTVYWNVANTVMRKLFSF